MAISTVGPLYIHLARILRLLPAAGLPTGGLAARTTLEEEDLEEEVEGRDAAGTTPTQVNSQQWSHSKTGDWT